MGCFSFLCEECGKGIRSTSFSGEECKLNLIKDGKVIQSMTGEYDSYGGVFVNDTQDPRVEHKLRLSHKWEDPCPDKPLSDFEKRMKDEGNDHWIWSRVCNETDFIAAVHVKCDKGKVYNTPSEYDPNQGWGDDEEECLLFNNDPDYDFEKKKTT